MRTPPTTCAWTGFVRPWCSGLGSGIRYGTCRRATDPPHAAATWADIASSGATPASSSANRRRSRSRLRPLSCQAAVPPMAPQCRTSLRSSGVRVRDAVRAVSRRPALHPQQALELGGHVRAVAGGHIPSASMITRAAKRRSITRAHPSVRLRHVDMCAPKPPGNAPRRSSPSARAANSGPSRPMACSRSVSRQGDRSVSHRVGVHGIPVAKTAARANASRAA